MTYSKTSVVRIDDKDYFRKTGKYIEYSIDERLKRRTDEKIRKQLEKKDKDFFAIIDGGEGTGKSTFAIQWAKYVDNSFNLSRIVFTPDEFKEAIFKAEKGTALIYDEAFTGLSSRSALSSINRYLVSLAMQIRQKNLFIILCLPSVFLLDKYFVMFRAKVLVHVYENKGRRGFFRVYSPNKIKRLILEGKSTYSYSKKIRTNFKGHFYGKFGLDPDNLLGLEKKYRDLKMKALESSETNPMTAGQVKYKDQRDLLLFLLRKNTKWTYQEIEDNLLDKGIDISYQQIRNVCAKFGDSDRIEDKIKDKNERREKRKKKKEQKEEFLKNEEQSPIEDEEIEDEHE